MSLSKSIQRWGDWSRLCKKFSAANQYRSAIMSVKSKGSDEYKVNQESLFIGLLTTKNVKQTGSVQLFCEQFDPDRLLTPVISVEKPVEIVLHKDKSGLDKWLTIEGKDGTVASIIFSSLPDSQQRNACLERLAYTISEHRGFAPGGNLDDWLNAEKIIENAELQFSG